MNFANHINEKNYEQAFLQDDSWAITSPSSKGHRLILALTDYFSKWAKPISMREVKMTDIVKCFKHHVICHFDLLRRIIYSNGFQFASQDFSQFYNKFRIYDVVSALYNLARSSQNFL